MFSYILVDRKNLFLGSAFFMLAFSAILSIAIAESASEVTELKRQESRLTRGLVIPRTASPTNFTVGGTLHGNDAQGDDDTFVRIARTITAQGLQVRQASSVTTASGSRNVTHTDIQFSVIGDYFGVKRALEAALSEHATVALEYLQLTKDAGSNVVAGELRLRFYVLSP